MLSVFTHFIFFVIFVAQEGTDFTVCLMTPVRGSPSSPVRCLCSALTHDALFPCVFDDFLSFKTELFICLGDLGQKWLPPERMCLLLRAVCCVAEGVLGVWDHFPVNEGHGAWGGAGGVWSGTAGHRRANLGGIKAWRMDRFISTLRVGEGHFQFTPYSG